MGGGGGGGVDNRGSECRLQSPRLPTDFYDFHVKKTLILAHFFTAAVKAV